MVILDNRAMQLSSPVGLAAAVAASSAGNQYLNPDYLAPLPTEVIYQLNRCNTIATYNVPTKHKEHDQTGGYHSELRYESSMSHFQLDSKSSPLAMLAKTCSQIGADTGPVRSRSASTTRNGSKSNGSTSCTGDKKGDKDESVVEDLSNSRSRSSSVEIRVTVDTLGGNARGSSPPPRLPSTSGSSTLSPASNLTSGSPRANATSTPPRSTAMPSDTTTTPSSSPATSSTPKRAATSTSSGSSPIVRSGLEVLAGYPGEVHLGTPRRPGDSSGLPSQLSALEDMNNLMAAGVFPRHPMFLGAASASGLGASPFLQAAGLLPASSAVTSPACRDPLCRHTVCPISPWSHPRLAAAGRAPSSGCSSYSPSILAREQHREAVIAAAMARAASSHSTPSLAGPASGHLPYVCNWVAGTNSECGPLRVNLDCFVSLSRRRLLRTQVLLERGTSDPPQDTHQPVHLRPRDSVRHGRRNLEGVLGIIGNEPLPVSPLRPPGQRRATFAVSRGPLPPVPAALLRRLPEPLRDDCGRGRGGRLAVPFPFHAAASDVRV